MWRHQKADLTPSLPLLPALLAGEQKRRIFHWIAAQQRKGFPKELPRLHFSQRIWRRFGFFAIEEKADESAAWSEEMRHPLSIGRPNGGRQGAEKCPFVYHIKALRDEVVRKEVTKNDVPGNRTETSSSLFDGDRRKINRRNIPPSFIESARFVAYTASGN